MVMRSPWLSSFSWIGSPLTSVPLVLPRSTIQNCGPRRSTRAWCPLVAGSRRIRSLSGERPTRSAASPAWSWVPASGPDSMFSCACGPEPVCARRIGCVSAPAPAAGAGGGCQAGMTVVDSCCGGGAMIVRSATGMGGAGGGGGGATAAGGAEATGAAGGPQDGAGAAAAQPLHGGDEGWAAGSSAGKGAPPHEGAGGGGAAAGGGGGGAADGGGGGGAAEGGGGGGAAGGGPTTGGAGDCGVPGAPQLGDCAPVGRRAPQVDVGVLPGEL